MTRSAGVEAEAVLDRFVETMFRLMMDHHQRHVVELDLTVPQAQALKVLRRGPLCTGELASVLQITAPAVTQLTNRLIRKQLIERRAADGDRRSVMVELTDRGKTAVDSFRERRNTIFRGALSKLSEDEGRDVVSVLARMVEALQEYEAEKGAGRKPERAAPPAETPVRPAEASNMISRAKPNPGGRRMKIEWD